MNFVGQHIIPNEENLYWYLSMSNNMSIFFKTFLKMVNNIQSRRCQIMSTNHNLTDPTGMSSNSFCLTKSQKTLNVINFLELTKWKKAGNLNNR